MKPIHIRQVVTKKLDAELHNFFTSGQRHKIYRWTYAGIVEMVRIDIYVKIRLANS